MMILFKKEINLDIDREITFIVFHSKCWDLMEFEVNLTIYTCYDSLHSNTFIAKLMH